MALFLSARKGATVEGVRLHLIFREAEILHKPLIVARQTLLGDEQGAVFRSSNFVNVRVGDENLRVFLEQRGDDDSGNAFLHESNACSMLAPM